MKFYFLLSLNLTLFFCCNLSFSQDTPKPVYVIVHGAWGGGWAFKKVDSLLTEKGCKVYRPTLTGQGEKFHLASPTIGLKNHINDIVNLILFEDLTNIILIGHSYGGMVVTGVADSLPNRIAKLVYLDAFLPENNESVINIISPIKSGFTVSSLQKNLVDGFLIPIWVRANKKAPKDVPHSYKTFTDSIALSNSLRLKIPTTYILTVGKGKKDEEDDFYAMGERAKKMGFNFIRMEGDHNPQWSAPVALANLFKEVGDK